MRINIPCFYMILLFTIIDGREYQEEESRRNQDDHLRPLFRRLGRLRRHHHHRHHKNSSHYHLPEKPIDPFNLTGISVGITP